MGIRDERTRSSGQQPATGHPDVKGLAFRSVLNAIEALHGAECLERTLRNCPAELNEALRYQRVIASGWFPIEWYRGLLSAFTEAVGGDPEAAVRQIGRRALEQDMNTVNRALLRLLSPDTALSAGSRIFKQFYSKGSLRVESIEKGYLRLHLTGCVGFDRNMYVEILGSTERLSELSGAKNTRGRIVGGGRNGSDYATIDVWWE